MVKTIIKRDGRKVEFDKMKIYKAIKGAMKEVSHNDDTTAFFIATKIEEKTEDILHIEHVQDLVEEMLMDSNLKNVARAYIIYRNKRTEVRNQNSEMNKKLSQIVKGKNIKNDNANIDDHSFNGRKYECTNVMQKEMANELMRDEVKTYMNDNRLYIHDRQDYVVGEHNCLNIRFPELLSEGFACRTSDIRPPKSLKAAGQLVPVIIQVASQNFFGGCASTHLDTDLVPYVKMSFIKHYKKGLKYINRIDKVELDDEDICIESEKAKEYSQTAYKYALDMIEEEASQSLEALYHNLNSLESRPGSQVPFSSINFGLDQTPEGRLIGKAIMNASLNGIGKHHSTPIFPISIFKYKKGVNAKVGDPNYDIKKLAIKSLCSRLFPRL